jgi:hypothetical protein
MSHQRPAYHPACKEAAAERRTCDVCRACFEGTQAALNEFNDDGAVLAWISYHDYLPAWR